MRITQNRAWLLGTVALAALGAVSSAAMAGGLEVREQSSFFQGTSFAGTAAGGSSLSSVYWNPAASSFVGSGITTDSSYSLVMPKAKIHATEVDPPGNGNTNFFPTTAGPFAAADWDVDMGRDAIVPASYAAWRFNDRTVFAVSMNSPFGLTTKPDNTAWGGNFLAVTSKVFSLNVTPTVSYQLTPQISIGAGVQFQYVELKTFRTAQFGLEGDDFGVGGVAGINITPFRGTSIGLGYRSQIDYDVEGDINNGSGAKISGLELPITTPDKVTLSFRQDVTPSTRLMGTVEWTNWSLLDVSPITATGPGNLPAPAAIDFGWKDGWFYSLGGEYDYSNKLTLRAGVAYEESPIQDDTARLIQVPDNNRVWASVGATYNWSDTTKINLAYSHVFVEDGDFQRASVLGQAAGGALRGEAESSADIVSVGLTMKMDDLFGHRLAEPLK